MAGRPPVPISIHKQRGTFKPCLHEGKLSLEPGDLGTPPDYITGYAREEWDRITGDPQYAKCLAPVDYLTVVRYCYLAGLAVAEMKDGEKFGASKEQALNHLRMHLGLTPASRTKVPVAKAEPDNRWAKHAK